MRKVPKIGLSLGSKSGEYSRGPLNKGGKKHQEEDERGRVPRFDIGLAERKE